MSQVFIGQYKPLCSVASLVFVVKSFLKFITQCEDVFSFEFLPTSFPGSFIFSPQRVPQRKRGKKSFLPHSIWSREIKDPGNEVVFLRGGPLLSPFKSRIPINLLQWTYCLAASSVTGSSVWFYVQTISHRNAAYCAAVLLGFGGSVMYVTSIALAGELIGESKDSGAFVFASMGSLGKVACGGAFFFTQEFFPTQG